MKTILCKTNKSILSIFLALVVTLGLFTAMPDKAIKANAYFSTTYSCGCDGGTTYVSQSDAVSYSGFYSWINVTKVVNGYFRVEVKPDTTVRTINTTRTAYINFKNSKGSTVYTLNVKQVEPYIYTSSTYNTVSKNTTSWASMPLSYNCKYTIEYPSDLIVKTSYGSTVYSGLTYGSNNNYGIASTDYLRIYPRYANTSNYNKYYTIRIKKAGSYTTTQTITVVHTYY